MVRKRIVRSAISLLSTKSSAGALRSSLTLERVLLIASAADTTEIILATRDKGSAIDLEISNREDNKAYLKSFKLKVG